jgi:hypothetical protein
MITNNTTNLNKRQNKMEGKKNQNSLKQNGEIKEQILLL